MYYFAYTVLHNCTELYCFYTTLYITALYCIIVYLTILYFRVLYKTLLKYIILICTKVNRI